MSQFRGRRGAGDGRAPRPDVAADRDADPHAVARTIVLDQLTVRARSRSELRTTLARRGVPDEVAESVLDRMEEIRLVDDEAFAGEWVRSRHRSRGLAGRALSQELRLKGVDDDLARAALEEIDPESERAAAEALVHKRIRSTRGLDRQVRVRRLAGMLARKGYASGLALSVVHDALAAEGEPGDDGGWEPLG
jgi:regulatory protein